MSLSMVSGSYPCLKSCPTRSSALRAHLVFSLVLVLRSIAYFNSFLTSLSITYPFLTNIFDVAWFLIQIFFLLSQIIIIKRLHIFPSSPGIFQRAVVKSKVSERRARVCFYNLLVPLLVLLDRYARPARLICSPRLFLPFCIMSLCPFSCFQSIFSRVLIENIIACRVTNAIFSLISLFSLS